MNAPPTGTVTFLFTDIEGSTRLWQDHPEAMRPVLARHDDLLRQSIEDHGGYVFKTVGDAFCAAFPTAPQALAAALQAQTALAAEPWPDGVALRVRMALHTGAAEERDRDYYGPPLNRVARLLSAGHGGQTLLSDVARDLTLDDLPPGASLADLGEHRLKDLGRPERVFQLLHPSLPAEFPPLRSLDSPDLPNNLPPQPTSFVGREREMAEVEALMDGTRLLTLTGAGGCGKTRLALQAAVDALDRFPDGAWLAELAPLSDPALVAQAVAQAVGVREQAGQPLLGTLLDWLRDKRLLLVLDNCEHLRDACASLAADLLRNCPGVHVLATSREPLGVPGERTYRVPSLAAPDPQKPQTAEALSQYEAVTLFVERARAVQPSFSVTDANAPAVAQVCWNLDGIPLAIELAAARVRAMPVEQVSARLDQRFRLLTGGSRTLLPRQQTLQALIDWSYDLLNEQEKALLARLSVFAGGWTLEAAEAVCAGGTVENWEVLDLLTSLVDKSLVVYEERQGDARYRLLETVRQYAGDRLAEGGEADSVRERHFGEVERLIGEEYPQGRPDVADWLRGVDAERDNVRAALDWGLVTARADEAMAVRVLRAVVFLYIFFYTRALFREGGAYALAALDANPAARQTGWAEQALTQAALCLAYQGDFAASSRLFDEQIGRCRDRGDDDRLINLINALYNYAYTLAAAGDFGRSVEVGEQALAEIERARTAGSAPEGFLRGEVIANLSWALDGRGDYDAALRRAREALALETPKTNRDWAAEHQFGVGMILLRPWPGRDPEAAATHLRAGLTIYADLGSREGIMQSACALARVAQERGEWERSARLLGAAAGLRDRYGIPLGSFAVRPEDEAAWRAAAREALGEEVFAAAWEAGRAMTWEQTVEYALSEREPQG